MTHWIMGGILVSVLASLLIARFIHVGKGPKPTEPLGRNGNMRALLAKGETQRCIGGVGHGRPVVDRTAYWHGHAPTVPFTSGPPWPWDARAEAVPHPRRETVQAVAKRYLDRLEKERGGEPDSERERRTR